MRCCFGGRRIIGLCLAVCLLMAATVGCGKKMGWGRDERNVAGIARRSTPEVLRFVNAPKKNERQIALRIIADRANEARRMGKYGEASELDDVVIRRYFIEREQDVRACIVILCAPAAGRGSTAMVKFLRDRIAAGEFPGYAALSLATLAPRNAVLDIEPLTRHPAPEVRLQAATALCVLGDPRGFGGVERVWGGMERSVWPERIEGMSREEARGGLEARARRSFGKDLRRR